jgi:hypothetical protein
MPAYFGKKVDAELLNAEVLGVTAKVVEVSAVAMASSGGSQ